MAESADAVDLKPTDLGHEGSTPSGPTTPKQRWESYHPASELPVAIGQRRLFFVDGFGEKEGVVTGFDDENCWLKEDDNDVDWCMGWEMPGMNAISLLVDGEELKRIMAEEAENAENYNPSQA